MRKPEHFLSWIDPNNQQCEGEQIRRRWDNAGWEAKGKGQGQEEDGNESKSERWSEGQREVRMFSLLKIMNCLLKFVTWSCTARAHVGVFKLSLTLRFEFPLQLCRNFFSQLRSTWVNSSWFTDPRSLLEIVTGIMYESTQFLNRKINGFDVLSLKILAKKKFILIMKNLKSCFYPTLVWMDLLQ